LFFNTGFLAENTPIHIADTVFEANTSGNNGGGAYLGQPALILDSRFNDNNSISASGGGLYANRRLVLHRTSLSRNQAANTGGGIACQGSFGSPSQVINSLFNDNSADGAGADLYLSGGGSLEVIHATFAGAELNPGQAIYVYGPSLVVTNTIVTNHAVGIELEEGTALAQNLLFSGNQQDTLGAVENNNPVYADAGFLDAAGGNYHLALGSAAIDAAVNAGVGGDLDGDIRPIIGLYDIGADEFGDAIYADPEITNTITGTIAPGRDYGIIIPPGAIRNPGLIYLLPNPIPPVEPPPRQGFSGFGLQFIPAGGRQGHNLLQIDPYFLLPVTITLTYSDVDVAAIVEDSLYLAVLDESSGEWIEATSTCSPAGSVTRDPHANHITVTTCASGEFVLLGTKTSILLYLPLINR
jgi:predicted outer membrane repeat protein